MALERDANRNLGKNFGNGKSHIDGGIVLSLQFVVVMVKANAKRTFVQVSHLVHNFRKYKSAQTFGIQLYNSHCQKEQIVKLQTFFFN